MKKFISGILALISIAFIVTSCEMKYDKDYPELVQYYCTWGDSTEFHVHDEPDLTLMSYDASTGKYSIEIETPRNNQRIQLTKGAGWSIKYVAGSENGSLGNSADADTQANFPKTILDTTSGTFQTALPTVGTYVITFDPATETYNVAAK